jgi:hypothetical protein
VAEPQHPWWSLAGEFPLFMLRLFAHPRSLLRTLSWEDGDAQRRVALYCVVWLGILLLFFGQNRMLSEAERPRLSTFKAQIMRAHDRSWDWLEPVYAPLNIEQGEAKRLWDSLLTRRFLAYTLLAGLLATALVARLRMWRSGLPWEQALGTGMLGYTAAASCAALSLVPLTLLLICRHCGVRLALCILLNLCAWAYMGYYCLGDLRERPGGITLLLRSLGYGFVLFAATYLIFFVLILCVIPI